MPEAKLLHLLVPDYMHKNNQNFSEIYREFLTILRLSLLVFEFSFVIVFEIPFTFSDTEFRLTSASYRPFQKPEDLCNPQIYLS